jgi:hypothetical protein
MEGERRAAYSWCSRAQVTIVDHGSVIEDQRRTL